MRNLLFFCLVFGTIFSVSSQLTLSDADYNQANPLDCGAIIPSGNPGTNFSDGTGNYTPNMNEILVLCPDPLQGTKVSIAFATNIGFEFNIHPSDTLYIYDGPNTASPLLGAYNSGTNPLGFYVQASFANNPSGCLTLQFVSDGLNEGTGWVANVACGNIPQPFEPHVEAFKNGTGPNALNPLDTGYVDVCFGDSILLVATPSFTYSFEATGSGYSQNVNNCDYEWTIGGLPYPNNDSIWFTPPQRAGYYVDLRITDIFPQSERITCKIRVSQQPLFTGTGPLLDTVCLGQNTVLVGGVTPTDTVGVEVPGGDFLIGGIFAGLTFLPDGAGLSYQSAVGISGFDTSAVISSASDISDLCIDIEHSYIGDLEIALTCPNGTTVSLMNAYNQTPFGWNELVPGGCGNGISTFLGNDTDNDGGAPGSPVWTYCFSPTNPTLGTICAEEAAGNVITNSYGNSSMDTNGVYLPDGDFNDFVGCPVNGQWTITVQDNQGIDDGYIFQWGIYFNSSLYPESEGYQNTIVSDFWNSDPSIISGMTDTLIIIQPAVTGNTSYTYNVIDDFGCPYDTTVMLNVVALPSIQVDTIACNYQYQVQGTTSYSGGSWYVSESAINFSNSNSNNPLITSTTAGIFEVNYVDEFCSDTVTTSIEFPPYIYVQVLDTVLCENDAFELNPLTVNSGPLQAGYNPLFSLIWEDGSTDSIRIVSQPGNYIAYLSNYCSTVSDTATIENKICEIEAPNIVVLSSQAGNNTFFVNYSGLESYNCVITNRWGNLVYEYSDPAGFWDGRTQGGTLVEEGVYFYKIKAKFLGGEDVNLHGFVHLKY